MDSTSFMAALQPAGALGPAMHSPHHLAQPPLAPPELVGKFEALMARTQTPHGAGASGQTVPHGVVAEIDHHLNHGLAALDDMMAVNRGQMSMTDVYMMQMRSVVQLGMLSATQSAAVQVLGATKGSINTLMKNQ